MRIAISGSAGIGKSSLARSLAERLGISLITENYEILLDRPDKFTKHDQVAAPIMEIFFAKQRLEEEYGSFVTDRCPVDLFHFWMKMGLWKREDETERLHNMAVQQVRQYDLLVLPPWGLLNITRDQAAEDSKKRASNRYVQMYNHASITGLAMLWMPADRIFFLPSTSQSLDERVEEVIRAISYQKSRSP